MRYFLTLISAAALFQIVPGFAQTQPQWRELPNAPARPGRHEDVYFVNPELGWVVNGSGEIHKTGNGGKNWKMQLDLPYYLRSVGFVDSKTGWVGTLSSQHVLYATNDGGDHWLEVTNLPEPKPAGICGIAVVNDSVVYGAGLYAGPPRMIKTTNKGKSWSVLDLSAHARALVDCYFWSVDSGIVVGAIGSSFDSQLPVVLSTSDGGVTWTKRYEGARPNELCWKISFPSKKTGYVSIEAFHNGPIFALKTRDRGMTWEEKKVAEGPHDMQGIGFATETLGWIGGRNPTYETADGGQTWRQTSFAYNLNRFRMFNDTLGYAVGQTVYKFSNETPVSVATSAYEFVHDFNLKQNYPNPFNPSTQIRFSLPRAGKVIVRVFDATGREVATLFEGALAVGPHSFKWNGANATGELVRSGVYFLRLEAGGEVAVRKMAVVR